MVLCVAMLFRRIGLYLIPRKWPNTYKKTSVLHSFGVPANATPDPYRSLKGATEPQKWDPIELGATLRGFSLGRFILGWSNLGFRVLGLNLGWLRA